MKKLKLLKPWRLPTVRLKLGADTNPFEMARTTPVQTAPCAAEVPASRSAEGMQQARVLCATPYDADRKRHAPSRRAIFASTASPHPGCPHLFS